MLTMKAFRPPVGSRKKQFNWSLWIVVLIVLALAIWFAPEYVVPMFGRVRVLPAYSFLGK